MQGTFACFLFLPSFAVESFARNVQNGFTLSFGRERFLFFFFDAKEEKMNNKLHNLCMWPIDVHNMGYVTSFEMYKQIFKTLNLIVYPFRLLKKYIDYK